MQAVADEPFRHENQGVSDDRDVRRCSTSSAMQCSGVVLGCFLTVGACPTVDNVGHTDGKTVIIYWIEAGRLSKCALDILVLPAAFTPEVMVIVASFNLS